MRYMYCNLGTFPLFLRDANGNVASKLTTTSISYFLRPAEWSGVGIQTQDLGLKDECAIKQTNWPKEDFPVRSNTIFFCGIAILGPLKTFMSLCLSCSLIQTLCRGLTQF